VKKETLTELNLPFLTLLLFGLVLKCVQNKGKKVIINIYKYYIIKKLFHACYRMISMFFLKNEITALFSETPVLLPMLIISLQINIISTSVCGQRFACVFVGSTPELVKISK